MNVIGSELLRDPLLQASVVDQRLPWMTSQESKKMNHRSGRTSSSKTVNKSSANMPKKILNMSKRSGKKQKKAKIRHGEPHPIIIKCVQYIDDEFWADIIEDMAYGTYPKDFSVRNNSLSFKKSNTRLINLSLIDTDDFESLSHKIIGFISSNANMYSADDIRNSRIIEAHQRQIDKENIQNITWKSIKSKNVQALHIFNYAIDLSNRYNINSDHVNSLLTFAIFMSDMISHEDIIFENGVISHIEGLVYDEENDIIYIDRPLKETKTKQLFIKDPMEKKSVCITNVMSDKLKNIDMAPKSKYSFDKQWNQALRDIIKRSSKENTSMRSHVMSTLSQITSEDIQESTVE